MEWYCLELGNKKEYKQGAGWNRSAFPRSAANKQQIPAVFKQEPELKNPLTHRFNITYFTFFSLN